MYEAPKNTVIVGNADGDRKSGMKIALLPPAAVSEDGKRRVVNIGWVQEVVAGKLRNAARFDGLGVVHVVGVRVGSDLTMVHVQVVLLLEGGGDVGEGEGGYLGLSDVNHCIAPRSQLDDSGVCEVVDVGSDDGDKNLDALVHVRIEVVPLAQAEEWSWMRVDSLLNQ